MQVYYWNSVFSYLNDYGYYAISQGLDISKPLDEQSCPEVEGYTWQKYFLEDALGDWQKYQAMALIAEGKKMELPEDLQKTLDNLRQSMSKTALEKDPEGYKYGTGPWVNSEFVPNISSTMVRNENFWGELPKTKVMEYIVYPEDAHMVKVINGECICIFFI